MTAKAPRYNRVLIKLSGRAMAGPQELGFDIKAIDHIVHEVMGARSMNVQISLLVGGGNIFRGNVASNYGIERAEADNIGMLGTVVNSLMLRGAIKAKADSIDVRVMTAVRMEAVAEPYIRLRAVHQLDKGIIVILAGGIGQPFVTTDYPAVQRAIEMRCGAIMVAKDGVDGVYTADPKKDPKARRYKTLGYDDVLIEKLSVMDHSALLLARDYQLPIHIFNFEAEGAMEKILSGEDVGTYIGPGTKLELA